jgi:hypothetical protein
MHWHGGKREGGDGSDERGRNARSLLSRGEHGALLDDPADPVRPIAQSWAGALNAH